MRLLHLALPFVFLAAMTALPARAADEQPATTQPGNEQVIEPQVARREVKLPKFPSNDFEFGLFAGTYATQNFGSSFIYGLRLGYHITEDIFVEGVYGRTKVSDENYRQILPGGIFPQPEETLYYYNLSAGYNVLPGEVFLGKNVAKASGLYLIGGVGSTHFLEQQKLTMNFGLGLRVFFKDWYAVQVDMRDHVYSLDLLGKRENTQNLEFSAGVTFFF
ncbi:MAG TPA: outer membrane beta-barrel domain-containing protein [Burkholderiaceae bacterium]|nr:outer membrane beta-barrel domain-containing protein [Burkholderiaceae bacterium]